MSENEKAPVREQTTIISFSIRIPETLHSEIKKEAEQINSSINSFMMVLLKFGLKVYKGNFTIQIQQE